MKKKRIYVCCGTGIATSTVIRKKVEEILKQNKINYSIQQYKVVEVPSKVQVLKPDIIISSTPINGNIGDVPVVLGRAFLTGIGKDKVVEEILDILKNN